MKLKTLKDLQKEADELSFGGYTIDTLRGEAIKWIKEMKNSDIYSETEQGIFESNFNVQEWIKHFFNITEEDIKNG